MEVPPKEENSMSVLIEKLTDAIINRDLNNFKLLIQNSSREWCQKTNRFGYTLLQEAIRRDSKEIFHHMLLFQDMLDLETVNVFDQTALTFLLSGAEWSESKEYYACELINKGAFIHTVCKNLQCDTFLHQAVVKSLKVTKLLLEKGISVNLLDKSGCTALDNVLIAGPHTDDYEFVAALLCYGIDPFNESFRGFDAFELSILYNHSVPIQEILFDYTFDKFICRKIHFKVLLQLAKVKSSFFYQILEHYVEFETGENWLDLFCDFFCMDVDYLETLLKKCNSVISEIFRRVSNDFQYTYSLKYRCETTKKWCAAVNFNHTLTNLSFLVENDATLSHHIVNFIGKLDSYVFCRHIIFVGKMKRLDATELLIYMFLYGLKCNNTIFDLVYKAYGYCDLFKFLLHLDLENDEYAEMWPNPENIVIPVVIYDINFDLIEFLDAAILYSFRSVVVQLLDYFAHPKLSNYLLNGLQEWNLSQETVRKIENHPRIPLLVELSRNAFRKYFVDRLNIKSTKEFYSLLNGLEISTVHKKIITFETKLY